MDYETRHKFEQLLRSGLETPIRMDVPCIDCLCLGVCKHKGYTELRDCETVENYIYVDRKLFGNPIGCLRLIKVARLFKNPPWKDELLEFLEIKETDYNVFFRK